MKCILPSNVTFVFGGSLAPNLVLVFSYYIFDSFASRLLINIKVLVRIFLKT